jgi:hypothetical protein
MLSLWSPKPPSLVPLEKKQQQQQQQQIDISHTQEGVSHGQKPAGHVKGGQKDGKWRKTRKNIGRGIGTSAPLSKKARAELGGKRRLTII